MHNIKGIDLGSKIKNILAQFADDTALFIHFDKISIEEVVRTFQNIEAATGLKISYEKTVIYRIGSIKNSDAKLYTQKDLHWTNEDTTLLGINVSTSNDCAFRNYESVIKKMSDTCTQWSQRPLTLMGKVVVINSLMESLFVYKLNALELMTEVQCKQVERLISQFLWSEKRPKIALKTLQLPKNEGGLRLFDIRNKQKALKIGWISKAIHNEFFFECFKSSFPCITLPFFWECNISKKDCMLLKTNESTVFWSEVLQTWCEANYHDPQNMENVLQQIIWYNTNIKVAGKWLFNQRAIDNKCLRIEDIVIGNRLMNFNEYVNKFPNCMHWLEYTSLCAAIPGHWKFFIKTEGLIDTRVPMTGILKCDKPSRQMYKILISNDTVIGKYWHRWREEGLMFESFKNYQVAFNALYVCTNVVKLRNFQYKLLLNKIFTNKTLHVWRVVDNPKCSFCKEKDETIIHVLWECLFAKRIWENVQNWMYNNHCNEKIDLNSEKIILNKCSY